MSFFCRGSDPYGSRHNTASSISDPNGSLALLRRRIYDPSGSVGKLWGWICDLNGSGIQILGIRSRDPFSESMGMSAIDDTLLLVAVVLAINPRLTGGAFDAPPSRIFAIAQKRTALSTWNLAGLLIQQFYIVRGIFLKSVGNFLRYGRFCDVTTRHFWSKIGQTSRVCGRRSF